VFDEEYGVWGGLPAAARRRFVVRLEAGEPLGAVLASALPTVREQAA
jgi:hypothetical protein